MKLIYNTSVFNYLLTNMKKTIIWLIAILTLWINSVWYASSWDIDFSTMTPQETLEFYKNNPDYGKKRLEIDYEKYIEGNYVVFRGEYYDKEWNPIANKPINFNINWDNYSYVTSDKGIFNLEINKENIEDIRNYNIYMEIDWYKIKARINWKELKEKSIYHFKIEQTEWDPYKLNLTTIHNNSFWDWENFFELNLKKKETPSTLWIQWIWLFVLVISIVTFISFFNYKYRRDNKKELKKDLHIPKNLK